MINEIVKKVHENAVQHGWWDEKRTALEIHALIHSEISEATESVRNGEPEFHYMAASCTTTPGKPEGQAVELVDAVIRVFDYFGAMGWDFDEILKAKMDYNKTRPYRHGGKKL